jgi:hypothetical protein
MMRRFIIVIFPLLIGCSHNVNRQTPVFTETIEDHMTTPYIFPPGTYYYFDFFKAASVDIDKDKILNEIQHHGIVLRDAWYKPYSSMCAPPGGDVGMMVIVEPEFVIRVEKKNPALNGMGFIEMKHPAVSDCAYRVIHYKY